MAPFDLKPFLNGFFAASKRARPKPGTYFVNGIRITKKGKLWTATLPGGDQLFSSHLGDLKETIRRKTA